MCGKGQCLFQAVCLYLSTATRFILILLSPAHPFALGKILCPDLTFLLPITEVNVTLYADFPDIFREQRYKRKRETN